MARACIAESGTPECRKVQANFGHLLGQRDELIAQRRHTHSEALFAGTQFTCSDEQVSNAFRLAKANIMMLTSDARPYLDEPVLLAGVPDYPQVSGNDGAYSTTGAGAAGLEEAARGTLMALARFAKQQEGRVPHEVVLSGRIISPGNVQETPRFAIACLKYYNWTGDRSFLEAIYPICKQGVEYTLNRYDADGNLYPKGNSIMEAPDMNHQIKGFLYYALELQAGMPALPGYFRSSRHDH
jgi:glycogen debranching enzyme